MLNKDRSKRDDRDRRTDRDRRDDRDNRRDDRRDRRDHRERRDERDHDRRADNRDVRRDRDRDASRDMPPPPRDMASRDGRERKRKSYFEKPGDEDMHEPQRPQSAKELVKSINEKFSKVRCASCLHLSAIPDKTLASTSCFFSHSHFSQSYIFPHSHIPILSHTPTFPIFRDLSLPHSLTQTRPMNMKSRMTAIQCYVMFDG